MQLAVAPRFDELFVGVLPVGIGNLGQLKIYGQTFEILAQHREGAARCGLVGEDAEEFIRIGDLFLYDPPVGRFSLAEIVLERIGHFVRNTPQSSTCLLILSESNFGRDSKDG